MDREANAFGGGMIVGALIAAIFAIATTQVIWSSHIKEVMKYQYDVCKSGNTISCSVSINNYAEDHWFRQVLKDNYKKKTKRDIDS